MLVMTGKNVEKRETLDTVGRSGVSPLQQTHRRRCGNDSSDKVLATLMETSFGTLSIHTKGLAC